MNEINNVGGNKSKLFAKVAQVMTEVRKLKKDGTNAYDKYSYITGDSAFEHIGGVMASVNLVMLPSVYEIETDEQTSKSGSVMYHTVIRAHITLADAETGETWTSEWAGEGSDRGDKSINKAMTAMMKYFLLRVFQIGSGEDADADSPGADTKKTAVTVNKPTQKQQPPAVQHRQPAQRQSDPVVKEVEFMGDADKDVKSPSVRRFHAEGTKTFGKQWDDARHWLIERYTKAMTPDKVRRSSNDMSGDELDVIADGLVEKRAYYQKEFGKAAGFATGK